MGADPCVDQPCVQVAEAAGLDRVVGRLHHHDQLGLCNLTAFLEELRQRAFAGGELLASEEQVGEIKLRLGERSRQLDHHGEAALHIARTEPDHHAVLEHPWEVVLGRHRVEMTCENHQRPPGTTTPDE